MKLLQIIVFICICFPECIRAQSPVQKFWALNQNLYILDQAVPVGAASFAYSVRKLRRAYTGFSLRTRRGTDNAEADVAFDGTGCVNTGSNVIVTAAGSSGLTVGATMSLSVFKGAQQLFVTIWYDQSFNAYHALQTTTTLQPELQMSTAAAGSTKPSLFFNGARYLQINQPIENLVASGVSGSFLSALKVTSNSNNFSFGYRNSTTDWRWTMHMNWIGGICYFDAGEVCCAATRSFANGTSLNLWKQYSFIRGVSNKLARLSGTSVMSGTATSTTQTGGQFYIGSAFGKPALDGSFQGGATEIILFPKEFSLADLAPLESNQIKYWSL